MRVPLLYFDFETTPMLVEVYRFYDAEVVRVREDVKILSVSWSWEGEDEIYHMALHEFKGHKAGLVNVNDKKLVQAFYEVLKNAEMVAAHNGKGFDFKVWRTRLVVHGLDPLHNMKELDTKQWARKFYFANNKQDNISRQIGTPRKEENPKEMHYKCYELNDPKAWAQNKIYNNGDVRGLKANAKRLSPYVPRLTTGKQVVCRNELCGSLNLKRDKYWKVANGWKIQFVCKACGSYTTAGDLYPEKPTIR